MHRTFSTEELTGTHVRMPVGFCDRLLELAHTELAAANLHAGDRDEPAHVLERWLTEKEAAPKEGDVDQVWHRIHYSLFERLVTAAQNALHSEARFVDDNEVPETTISRWLESIERRRTSPTPSAEPGDLLVKLARGEFWAFSVQGWRELAPVEVVGAGTWHNPDFPPEGAAEILDPAAWAAGVRDLGNAEEEFDRRFARRIGEHKVVDHLGRDEKVAGVKRVPGYSAPVYEAGHVAAPPSRFFGRSVVEDALDGARLNREGFDPPVQKTLDELLHHHNVLEDIASALEQGEDGGNNHPFFESAATARVFARALDYARRRLIVHATEAWMARR